MTEHCDHMNKKTLKHVGKKVGNFLKHTPSNSTLGSLRHFVERCGANPMILEGLMSAADVRLLLIILVISY